MIVVDTSALMAIALEEGDAERCAETLRGQERLIMSAGTLLEVLFVAQRRGVEREMEDLLEQLAFEIIPVTAAIARGAARAYAQWGAGRAGLNFGDCFAYQAAKEAGCPLLFVGEDFRRTDMVAA